MIASHRNMNHQIGGNIHKTFIKGVSTSFSYREICLGIFAIQDQLRSKYLTNLINEGYSVIRGIYLILCRYRNFFGNIG